MRILVQLFVLSVLLLAASPAYSNLPIVQTLKGEGCGLYDMEDVDSISYSHYDIDSVWHDDLVSQVIWISGRAHINMLSEIDSVNFYHLTNKVRPGVVEISEAIRQEIAEVDYINFQWKMSSVHISDDLISIGRKFYTLDMDSALFPCGFMGQVIDVESNGQSCVVKFMALDYEDVFESYYGRFNTEMKCSNVKVHDVGGGEIGLCAENHISDDSAVFQNHIPAFEFNYPLYLPEPVAGFEIEGMLNEVSVHFSPSLNVENDIAVIGGRQIRRHTIDAALEMSVAASFRGDITKTIKMPLITIDRPIPVAPMLCLYAESGPLLDLSVENATISCELNGNFRFSTSSTLSKSAVQTPIISVGMGELSLNRDKSFICGDGKIDAGAYFEVGIETLAEALRKRFDPDFPGSLGSLGAVFSGGCRLDAKVQFTESDWENSTKTTKLYEALTRPDNVSAGVFGEVSAEASALTLSFGVKKEMPTTPVFQMAILPKFAEVTFDTADPDVLYASAMYEPSVCAPMMGLVGYNQDNPAESRSYNAGRAENRTGGLIKGAFPYPGAGQTFCYRPYMQQGDKLILAKPDAQFGVDNFQVVSAEVEDSYVSYNKYNGIWSSADPIWEVEVKVKKPKRAVEISHIIFSPDESIDKSNGRMYHSNQWENRDYKLLFQSQDYSESDEEIVLNFTVCLSEVNLYFTENDGTVAIKMPFVLNVYLRSGEYVTVDGGMAIAKYNVSHEIDGVSCDYRDNNWTIDYSGSVEGLVVYALFLQNRDSQGLLTSQDFQYDLLGGVIEEVPGSTVGRHLRDGDFRWTLNANLWSGCETISETYYKGPAGDGYDDYIISELKSDAVNVNPWNYYKIPLGFCGIEVLWESIRTLDGTGVHTPFKSYNVARYQP